MRNRPAINFSIIVIIFCIYQLAFSGSELIGKPAPEFSLPAVNEQKTVHLKTFTGKIVLLDFWATWCAPCKKSLPRLADLQTKYGKQIQVLAISVDDEKKSAAKFLRKFKIDLLTLHDTKKKVADDYGVPAMPTLFILDKKGIVRYIHDGYTESRFSEIENEIKKLL